MSERMHRGPIGWLLATLVPSLVGFAIAAAAHWPGSPVDCTDSCFCEAAHGGWIRQPSNTFSNAVPVALAIVAAWQAVAVPATSARGVFVRAFPVALAFQGVGSMFFHASLVEWGGRLDSLSMLGVMALFFAVNLSRATKGVSGTRVLATWLGITLAGLPVSWLAAKAVPLVMFVLLIANLSVEVVLSKRQRTDDRWLRGGLLVFLASNVVWTLSVAPTEPLCSPTSLLQGHAVWHAGAGVAVFLLGRHFERALATIQS